MLILQPPKITCFLLICLSLPGTDSLAVKTSDFPIKSLRNQEAFIPCTITDYGTGEMDVKFLSVTWTLKSLNGSEGEVYLYVSGTHTPTRPGSYISDSETIRGNVGLHLPRVQFTDEGEYTCIVFYTPNKVVGKSALQVSVQPIGSLQPPAGSVLIGAEKTVQCTASGFYPKDITIQWAKQLSETNCISLDKDSCTGDSSGNEDGTFNVTSQLSINPSLEDNGKKYFCIMKHRSLDTDLKLNFILSVTEPPPEDTTTVPALVGTFLGVIFLGLGCFFYWKFLKKEPPKLSPITGAEHLVHMNKATLSCQISGFRPKPIRITLCLKRTGGEQMEIDSWDSEAQTGSSVPVAHHSEVNEPESEGLMRNGDVNNQPPAQRPLRVEMFPIIATSKSQRLSNCQCKIHITPNTEEDNGAELTVRVNHSALRPPISVSCQLIISGVKPKLSKIVSPLRILHEEPLTLTCPINGFKPKPLQVAWLKVDSNGETELLSWDQGTTKINDPKYSHQLAENEKEEAEDDHIHYFLSNLTLTPTVRGDDGAQFICRTLHYKTGERAEKCMKMQVLAVPELDAIQNSPEVLYVGEEMKLSCRIHSFHPQTLGVSWYKENEKLEPYNDPILTNASGLLHFTSRITYRPCVRDIGKKFRCEVSHPSLQIPKCGSWELKHLIGEPRVSAIKCDPEVPEYNQPTTLSCTIEKFYPKDFKIQWYRGLEVIKSENDPEVAEEDPESGLFSRTTEIHITPTVNDHETEFQVEIMYRALTIKKTFCMRLKGLPFVKEIILNKYPPKYGEPLTLSCEVSGCSARDIAAEWRENNNPTKMRTETQINGDSFSYLLTLMPTAEHYGKLFTCLVKHKDLSQAIKRNMCLKLPESLPTLSEIMVSPRDPQINRETSFTITISGFNQRNLQVNWLKSSTPLTENVVTTVPQIGKDNLYSCTSTVRYTPTNKDLNLSIQCEVTANKETRVKKCLFHIGESAGSLLRVEGKKAVATGKLEVEATVDVEKEPQVGEIECVTPNPSEGESVTLQCMIKGQHVEHGDFSWSDGIFPIDEDLIDNSNLTDGSGCISKVTFTPDDGHIRFEATFNFVTTERTFQLPWV